MNCKTFTKNELVWAKIKSLSWWPARVIKIIKLIVFYQISYIIENKEFPESSEYILDFLGDISQIHLNINKIEKFTENLKQISENNSKNLNECIDAAKRIQKGQSVFDIENEQLKEKFKRTKKRNRTNEDNYFLSDPENSFDLNSSPFKKILSNERKVTRLYEKKKNTNQNTPQKKNMENEIVFEKTITDNIIKKIEEPINLIKSNESESEENSSKYEKKVVSSHKLINLEFKEKLEKLWEIISNKKDETSNHIFNFIDELSDFIEKIQHKFESSDKFQVYINGDSIFMSTLDYILRNCDSKQKYLFSKLIQQVKYLNKLFLDYIKEKIITDNKSNKKKNNLQYNIKFEVKKRTSSSKKGDIFNETINDIDGINENENENFENEHQDKLIFRKKLCVNFAKIFQEKFSFSKKIAQEFALQIDSNLKIRNGENSEYYKENGLKILKFIKTKILKLDELNEEKNIISILEEEKMF